jgi:hypothetical protein
MASLYFSRIAYKKIKGAKVMFNRIDDFKTIIISISNDSYYIGIGIGRPNSVSSHGQTHQSNAILLLACR